MLSWMNRSKLLLPFFWSVPVRQRIKMRRKRKSFPILFCLLVEQPSDVSSVCFCVQLHSSASLCVRSACCGCYSSHRKNSHPQKTPTTPDISCAAAGMRLPSVLTCTVRGNHFTHDLCHGVAPSCDVFYGIQTWRRWTNILFMFMCCCQNQSGVFLFPFCKRNTWILMFSRH